MFPETDTATPSTGLFAYHHVRWSLVQEDLQTHSRLGDGWLPVAQNIGQVVAGMKQIKELVASVGREDKQIHVNVLGGEGQWRTRREIEAFLDIGVEQVTIWLTAKTTDSVRRELDALATEMFGSVSV